MCKTTTTTTIFVLFCLFLCLIIFSIGFQGLLCFTFFYFCFCSTPTTKRKDSPIDVLTLSVQLYNIFCPADFLFVLFVYISLTRNSHNGDEFVCIFVSFFLFFTMFAIHKKLKKMREISFHFFFAGYIYTRFALFSGSTTHKRSLGLCLYFFLLICIATGHRILNIYKILKKLERLCRAQPNFGGPPPPGTRWRGGELTFACLFLTDRLLRLERVGKFVPTFL